MFELNLALKYLLPKKNALSRAVISIVSLVIISLVVWLVLVFLSVTSGIEKNWLGKLTTLNAPVRLTPTDEYYASYYYLIDSISSASDFSYKTIKEKAQALKTDPYDRNEDMQIPAFWPKPVYAENHKALDIVKETYRVLDREKEKDASFSYEDFEMGGALMRLTLSRPSAFLQGGEKVSYLSQMSYLLGLNQKNPFFHKLLIKPSVHDMNNLLRSLDRLSSGSSEDITTDLPRRSQKNAVRAFFKEIRLKKAVTDDEFVFPLSLFPKKAGFRLQAKAFVSSEGKVEKLFLPQEKRPLKNSVPAQKKRSNPLLSGLFTCDGKNFSFVIEGAETQDSYASFIVDSETAIVPEDKIILDVQTDSKTVAAAASLEDVCLWIKGRLQDRTIQGKVNFSGLQIYQAEPVKNISSSFCYHLKNDKIFPPVKKFKAFPALLPKPLQNSGALIGDPGYLAFACQTASSLQEMRLPIYVAGFYDPGILPIGGRCLILPQEAINTVASSNMALENQSQNGIFVWFKDLKKAETVREDIEKKLQEKNLAKYWQVQTYKDYEFSKDLLLQFQSDRLLLTLIALIIIIVACSNIISFLMLLINDKKREIAILQSMGASKKSIALIFGICGFILGTVSSLIGALAAIATLRHLDALVNFLSFIQGHSAFNAAFFGNKLPNILSSDALLFVLITTPVVALAAGLIPALKACKLHPSSVLREG